MKWRSISELSDEQRDGRHYMFAEDCPEQWRYVRFFKDGSWRVPSGEPYTDDEFISAHYFLDEPLPDLPKPQKMEWRRLEEEWPLNFPIICRLLSRENILIEETYTFEANRKIISYWAPIVPPENE